MWSFLFDPTIDATNRRAEPAILAVVARKVWGAIACGPEPAPNRRWRV